MAHSFKKHLEHLFKKRFIKYWIVFILLLLLLLILQEFSFIIYLAIFLAFAALYGSHRYFVPKSVVDLDILPFACAVMTFRFGPLGGIATAFLGTAAVNYVQNTFHRQMLRKTLSYLLCVFIIWILLLMGMESEGFMTLLGVIANLFLQVVINIGVMEEGIPLNLMRRGTNLIWTVILIVFVLDLFL